MTSACLARTWALAALVMGCGVAPHEALAQGPDRGDPVRVIVAPGLVFAGGSELESGIGGVGHLAVERGQDRHLGRGDRDPSLPQPECRGTLRGGGREPSPWLDVVSPPRSSVVHPLL